MEGESLAALKELGIASIAVIGVLYILREVIINLREEHKKNQDWFMTYVNENNHKVTDLVGEVSRNIATNTASNERFIKTLEDHTEVVKKLVDKVEK